MPLRFPRCSSHSHVNHTLASLGDGARNPFRCAAACVCNRERRCLTHSYPNAPIPHPLISDCPTYSKGASSLPVDFVQPPPGVDLGTGARVGETVQQRVAGTN